MADGVTLNPGSGGAVIDTETNAGRGNAQMQRVKLVLGAVDTDGGNVSSTNPLPVAIVSGGASLADQSVVDAAGVYWLVRDNGSSLTYINWATGAAGTPTGAVAPAGKLTGEQVRGTQYNATAAGTGISVGDVIEHIVVLNIATSPATVITSAWLNITQASVLTTAPTLSNLAEIAAAVQVSNLPAAYTGHVAYTPGTVLDMRAYATVTLFCANPPSAATINVSGDPANAANVGTVATLSNPVPITVETNGAAGIGTSANPTAACTCTFPARCFLAISLTGGSGYFIGASN